MLSPCVPSGGLRLGRLLSDQAGCPSVRLDVEGCGVQVCSSAGSAAHPSCPVCGPHSPPPRLVVPAVQQLPACALPCPASAAPAPELQGTPHFCFTPSVPFPLLLSTPLPTFTFSETEGKEKTVKWGMLTDKPTQLSEASMSVLWMILFTS